VFRVFDIVGVGYVGLAVGVILVLPEFGGLFTYVCFVLYL